MSAMLVTQEAFETAMDAGAIADRLERGDFFWLDLLAPSEQEFTILRDVFQFHALAVEDSESFGQRAKLEEYEDFLFMVLYGAAPHRPDGLLEVHCFYSDRFLVTVRREEAPAFAELRRQFEGHRLDVTNPILLLYRLVDGLVDSFFPVLSAFDDRIDSLQSELLEEPKHEHLNELFAIRRRLVALRRAVIPQRDLFSRILGRAVRLPGMTPDTEHYFRDVYDHLILVADSIDSHRDITAGTMDLYLSTTSNRLNAVMKQLTVIATVFLPLTFLTGFFGQNFAWLVSAVGGWPEFFALGVGLELLTLVLLLGMFKRRGWF